MFSPFQGVARGCKTCWGSGMVCLLPWLLFAGMSCDGSPLTHTRDKITSALVVTKNQDRTGPGWDTLFCTAYVLRCWSCPRLRTGVQESMKCRDGYWLTKCTNKRDDATGWSWKAHKHESQQWHGHGNHMTCADTVYNNLLIITIYCDITYLQDIVYMHIQSRSTCIKSLSTLCYKMILM